MFNRHLSRRAFASVAAVAVAGVASPALRAQARPEKSRLTLASGAQGGFHGLALTVAEQLGFFRAEGLDVDIGDPAEAVADVTSAGFENVIEAHSRGHHVQAFVLQGRAPQIALGVSPRAMPYYRTVADLRGRKIGVSAPGSSASMVANIVLMRAGVRPLDVNFVPVGSSLGALSALRLGQVDALSNLDPVMTMLEQRGEVRIISDTRTLKGSQEVFGGPMPSTCLYAPQEFIDKHPLTCQALANAVVRALKWLQTAGPSDIIKTVPDVYLMGDRAMYLAAFNKIREAISPDGLMPEDGVRTALRVVASYEPLVKADKIDLAKTFTNDFARRAKARFHA
jgi:NitT/TauT family transport system substrate-binding protein